MRETVSRSTRLRSSGVRPRVHVALASAWASWDIQKYSRGQRARIRARRIGEFLD